MNFELFRELYSEALEYDNVDMYTSERGWQDWMNKVENPAEKLHDIYTLAKSTVRETRNKSGMSQKNFSKQFLIPLRTWADWEYENRTPPTYVKMLIDYAVFNYEN